MWYNRLDCTLITLDTYYSKRWSKFKIRKPFGLVSGSIIWATFSDKDRINKTSPSDTDIRHYCEGLIV